MASKIDLTKTSSPTAIRRPLVTGPESGDASSLNGVAMKVKEVDGISMASTSSIGGASIAASLLREEAAMYSRESTVEGGGGGGEMESVDVEMIGDLRRDSIGETNDAHTADDEDIFDDSSPTDAAPRPRRRTVSFLEEHGCENAGAGAAAVEDGGQTAVEPEASGTVFSDAVRKDSPSSAKMFRVAYLGNSVMDRRYPSDLQPWVMAEMRRIGTTTPVVLSAIAGTSVAAVNYPPPGAPAVEAPQERVFLRAVSEMDSSVLFEHEMTTISRFVRLHGDKLCFAYIAKNATNVEMPYTCYVFLGYTEDVVPAIFNLVRRCAHSSSTAAESRLRSGSCSRDTDSVGDGSLPSRPLVYDNFEVQLLGRLRVSGHKGPDSLIDDCLHKMEKRRVKRLNAADAGTEVSSEKPVASDGFETSIESVAEKSRRSGVVNEAASTTTSVAEDSSRRPSPPGAVYPRAVIFQVGVNDILVRDPTDGSVESKNYEHISKCQTGLQAVDHFGFIWRETVLSTSTSTSTSVKRDYYVYVFKGASESVVNEIMLKLHQAFSALHAQRTQARSVTCELCPMHQLHRLCREIEGVEAEKAIGVLVQRIEAQDEEDVELIVRRYKMESPKPNDPQDHLEVLMSVLRHFCQQKQQNHIHIADRREGTSGANGPSSSRDGVSDADFILDAPPRKVSAADKVSHFFKKTAKKSLLATFEQLVKGGEVDEDSGSGGGGIGDRRPSVQMLHSMTDAFAASSAGEDAAAFARPASPSGKRAKDPGLPPPSRSAASPKSRPRSKTLGQLPALRRKKEEEEAAAARRRLEEEEEASLAAKSCEVDSHLEFVLSPKKKMFTRIGHPGSGHDEVLSVGTSSRKSSIDSEVTDTSVFLDDSPPSQFRRNKSWRQSLYRHVVTPGKKESDAESRRGSLDPRRASLDPRHGSMDPRRGSYEIMPASLCVDPTAGPSSRRPSANVEALTWVTSPTSPSSGTPHPVEGRKRSSAELRDLWRSAITQQILLNKMERQNSQLAVSQDKAVLKRERLVYEELTPCLKQVSAEWDQALHAAPCSSTLPRSRLRDLVRRGVPRAKRGAIWKLLMRQDTSLSYVGSAEAESSVDADRPFDELLKLLTIHQHAILIDLSRTFPSHPYFSKQLGQGQLSLFNLLKAYSLIDPSVGYCQGLSFVAGVLLMHLDEVDAFEAMKHLLLTRGLRHQYCPEMTALQVQMYQLSRLIHDHYPKLSKKLDSFEMSPTLFAASWFLTLFASQFPLGFVARVFDMVFLEGVQAVFKVSVALLGQHLPLILECDSFESLVEFLKNTLPALSSVQMERVIAEAFELEEDSSKNLNAYQIEYHIFQDELAITPGGSTCAAKSFTFRSGGSDDAAARMTELEQANRKLKQQNFALLEQLQAAQATLDQYASTVKQLKGKIADLESEARRENGDFGSENAAGAARELTMDAAKIEDLKLLLSNNNISQ